MVILCGFAVKIDAILDKNLMPTQPTQLPTTELWATRR